jgi:uncharacterized MAPEG superfamily protein
MPQVLDWRCNFVICYLRNLLPAVRSLCLRIGYACNLSLQQQ